MNVAIIGGGFTGLTAAYELIKRGHDVSIFERDDHLGGLAWGFKEKNWDWHLEGAYHHLFTNDTAIIHFMNELGIGDKLIMKRPITANLVPSTSAPGIYQLDSPLHLLQFPGLSLSDKLRTGALAAFCKLYPFWQTLEGVTAKEFFIRFGGRRAWNIIWEPLMTGKFGHLDNTIAASWLWARIHKRTPTLCYVEGGFQTVVETLVRSIKRLGGNIYTGVSIESIQQYSPFTLHNEQFDKILLTVPTPIANTLLSAAKSPASPAIPHLHAHVLILETDNPILKDVYWLSITDRSFPFLAMVAHTNFIDKKHYGGHHLTYIGNYLPEGHPYLSMNKKQLLQTFYPFISRISGQSKFEILNSFLFFGPYAQPVHQIHYSQRAPKFVTSIPNVYLANMDSIYPWDRGTNYAVELGQKAASNLLQMA